MKMNRTIVKLVLSVLSILMGIVWTGALIILAGTDGAPIVGLLMLFFFSTLFLVLGIRGFLKWKKTSGAEGTTIPRVVPILLGTVGVLLVIQMATVFPHLWKNGQLDRSLIPYVKMDDMRQKLK